MEKPELISYNAKTRMYDVVSFRYDPEQLKSWWRRNFWSIRIEAKMSGKSFSPEQLIPYGLPFEFCFSRNCPKTNEEFDRGVLEERILTSFIAKNLSLRDYLPKVIERPEHIYWNSLPGNPGGFIGPSHVTSTLRAYQVRNE